MKRVLSLLVLAGTVSLASYAQEVILEQGKFHAGDDMSWAGVNVDESGWKTLSNMTTWT